MGLSIGIAIHVGVSIELDVSVGILSFTTSDLLGFHGLVGVDSVLQFSISIDFELVELLRWGLVNLSVIIGIVVVSVSGLWVGLTVLTVEWLEQKSELNKGAEQV